MTDRINEALARSDEIAKDGQGGGFYVPDVEIFVEAARAYVRDWITCPTCGGSGWINERDFVEPAEVCPDCVDGMIPSPELIERGIEPAGKALYPDAVRLSVGQHEMARRLVLAVLLASRQGDT